MPNLEADIPERDKRLADDLFNFLAQTGLGLDEKNIHVAERGEFAASISAEGHHAELAAHALREG